MARDHAGQVLAKRNECSRRFKHCHAITRKVKRITSIIGPTSMIAVEQQPISNTQSQQHMLQYPAQV
jgi:hypothetical protein